jgi:hypothetical protein
LLCNSVDHFHNFTTSSALQGFELLSKKYNPVNDIINDLDLLWKNVKPVSFSSLQSQHKSMEFLEQQFGIRFKDLLFAD